MATILSYHSSNIVIKITICLWIQNTILNSVTEGHYIKVHGNLKYGIGQKIVFLSDISNLIFDSFMAIFSHDN